MIDIPHHPPQHIDQSEEARSPWCDYAVIHFLKVLTQIRDEIREEIKWDERNPKWFPRWLPQPPAPKDAGFT